MSERARAALADVAVGADLPVVVMGVVNVSPESFYGGSVRVRSDELLALASRMIDAGAALVDVGARSTAPYRQSEVGEEEEADRLSEAVAVLVRELPVPVSADTCRRAPARAAFDAGARVLNDVSGLRDLHVARLAAERGASCLLMASPDGAAAPEDDPISTVRGLLREALARARAAGIREDRLVLDPGIGFFRDGAAPWPDWDIRVMAGLRDLADLGCPLAVGVSRKSFIGALTGHKAPEERLAGSLAATTAAVLAGAALVRTHDVAETVDAVRVAEAVRQAAER